MGDRITTIKDCPKCGGKGTFECYEALSSNLKYDECSNCDYNVSYDFEEQADGVVNITALPSEHLTPKGASKHSQDTPISNTLQYKVQKLLYYHLQDEVNADNVADAATEIIELLAQPHPSNTEQLDKILDTYRRRVVASWSGLDNANHAKDDATQDLFEWRATHTAEAVREALAKHVLAGMPELTPRQQEYITKVLEEL